jgi:hypothetical protein
LAATIDFDKNLWPDELGNDQQHRSWSIVAEETRADRCIPLDVFRACQILGHLNNIGHNHVGLRQQVHDILPGKLGLTCDVVG